MGNVTLRADLTNNALNVSFEREACELTRHVAFLWPGMGNTNFGSSKVVWKYGNTFRVPGALS